MKYERTEVIHAPPSRVWDLLVDVERWPTWTASMQEVTRLEPGPLAVGSTAHVRQPEGRPMTWTVTELRRGRAFTWTAAAPGLRLTGKHQLAATGDRTRAVLAFEMTGTLVRLAQVLAGARIRRYTDLEMDGLRAAAEGITADKDEHRSRS